jgi:hypothetical protein
MPERKGAAVNSRIDFDQLAKDVARGLSRREVLRRLAGGLAAGMLAELTGWLPGWRVQRVDAQQAASLANATKTCSSADVARCTQELSTNLPLDLVTKCLLTQENLQAALMVIEEVTPICEEAFQEAGAEKNPFILGECADAIEVAVSAALPKVGPKIYNCVKDKVFTYFRESLRCLQNRCSGFDLCSNDVCCAFGRTGCTGTCVDPNTFNTDPMNCGGCGNPPCPTGYDCCGGNCTDTRFDPQHCCPAGQTCAGGGCMSCPSNQPFCCNGVCSDRSTDPNN